VPANTVNPHDTYNDICRDDFKSWDNIKKINLVIFPGTTKVTNNFGTTQMSEIVASQNITISRKKMYEHSITDAEITKVKTFYSFMVVGCISYDYDGSSDVHQTGFT